MAKLELLSWDSFVPVKVLRNPALNRHLIQFSSLLKKLIPGHYVSTVTESLSIFSSLLKQFLATRKIQAM